jgi:two-component system, chemotaxis family, chemotaxis protein CheY
MRFLIVDDSKTMRSILASFAHKQGFATAEAEDGVDACNLLENDTQFDAILIDWDMPKMTGIELLKIIRSDPSFDHIKTMMVTAQSNYDCVTEAIMAGADDYLMKPLNEGMFVDKLRLLGLVA